MFDFALAIIITNTVDHHSQGFPNSSKKCGGGGGGGGLGGGGGGGAGVYWVKGGVILMIRNDSSLSVNTEHQLKPKLT